MDDEAKFLDKATHEGFPNAALDQNGLSLSLDRTLITKPASTFFMQAIGNSLEYKGIFDKDILVVDKSLHPKNKDVVVCQIDGSFKLREIIVENGQYYLVDVNKKAELNDQAVIWGVLKASIKRF